MQRGGRLCRLIGAVILAVGTMVRAAAAAVDIGPGDRVLVLAPHPDDETLGCAGVVQRARATGAPVRIAFLTDGDANELSFAVWKRRPVIAPEAVLRMGTQRRDEAVAAGQALGLARGDLVFLGYPDFGTYAIWKAHWLGRPPLRSLLTRVTSVPYADALHPGAPYVGESILADLTAVIRDFRPTMVFVSHPGDVNPDHRALYLFTRVALWNLAPELAPMVHAYLVHHPRWPLPTGLHEALPLDPPATMAAPIAWQRVALDTGARRGKLVALRCHQTQMRYSADFLLSFVRTDEVFGDFPTAALRSAGDETLTASGEGDAAPDELTDAERARFVGVEWRSIRLDGATLVVTLHLSRPLGEAVGASLFLFGWRADRPFAAMPKVRIELGAFAHGVFDQDRTLAPGAVHVERQPREITVRVPLAVLGDPTRVLTSGGTSFLEVPLGTLAWRILTLG